MQNEINREKMLQYFSTIFVFCFVQVDVGKSKVMRCSRYGNGDRMHVMHVILNGEPLEQVDCFKYLGWQVTADR